MALSAGYARAWASESYEGFAERPWKGMGDERMVSYERPEGKVAFSSSAMRAGQPREPKKKKPEEKNHTSAKRGSRLASRDPATL